MPMVLICRDALEDSVLGNIALARAVAGRGEAVVLLFTGEALAALDTGTFRWSPNFKTRDARSAIVSAAEDAGLPFAHLEIDRRWSDVRTLARSAAGEPNLRLVACPLWCRFLSLGKEPDYLERIDEAELVDLLKSANATVGSY
jgi:hypothetical protein